MDAPTVLTPGDFDGDLEMHTPIKMKHGFLLATTVAGLSLSNVAPAQDTGAFVLEEIIVTAQKREQSLQDVPISVNVMTGDLSLIYF